MKKFLSDVLIECGLQVSGTTTLGTATATTVATSDNSTNIATTAWVKSLGYTGYTSWNLKTNSVQRTTVQSGGDLDLIAGTDISISYGAGGKVTIASTATGSVDYISNVALNGSNLDFTGVGTAFTGSIDLSGLNPTVRTVYETVKNVSGAPIQKGTPLAVVPGQTSGNVSDVVPADAADPAFMPAVFIANADIADQAEGEAVLFGYFSGVDTSLYQSGTTVYVAPGGGWTADKPVWPDKIQNLGVITKQHATNGAGIVTGVGRANDLPNLTAGKIWVGSANYPIESTTVHVDEANGRLGVGTASPTGVLHVYSGGSERLLVSGDVHVQGSTDLNINGASRRFSFTNGTGTIRTTTANKLFIETNSTTAITVDASQNVGIGTTSPTSTLQVDGQVLISATAPLLDFVDTNSFSDVNDRFRVRAGGNEGLIQWYDHSSNGLLSIMTFQPNGNVIVPNGNVGIGTTSPSYKLDVAGAAQVYDYLRITNTGGAQRLLLGNQDSSGANNPSMIIAANGNTYIGGGNSWSGNGGTIDYTATFSDGGNVGIGTTSPTYRVHAKTDSTTWGYRFENNTGDQDAHVFMSHGGGYGLAVDTTDNRSSTYLLSLKGGTGGAGLGTVERFRVASDGNIYLNTYLFAYEDTSYTRLYRPNGSAGIYLGGSGDPANYYDNDYHYFRTSGAVANLGAWNSTGLGIGTTSPGEKLHVVGAIKTSRTTGATENIFIYNQATAKWGSSTYPGIIESVGNNSFLIGSSQNIPLHLTRSGAIALTVGTGGNIGIGTTSPAEKLHVVGNVQIQGGSTSVVLETNNKGADPAGALFGEYDIATTYGAIVDYVIYDAGRDNMRSGTFSAVWNGAETRYNDVSTVDIGDTSVITLTSQINGANVELIVTGEPVFTIKFNTKLIK